jgi:hypothetical protein
MLLKAWNRRSIRPTNRFYPIGTALSTTTVVGKTLQPHFQPHQSSTTPFLPVSIVDAGPDGQLEIELANACVVRLEGAIDPELLRIAIKAAGRLGRSAQGAN